MAFSQQLISVTAYVEHNFSGQPDCRGLKKKKLSEMDYT